MRRFDRNDGPHQPAAAPRGAAQARASSSSSSSPAASRVVGVADRGGWCTASSPRRSTTQSERNSFLKSEIAKLDKQIKEIDKLRTRSQALLARKQVVETLQADRASRAPARPAGAPAARRRLPQVGEADRREGHVVGYAQSNARVSTLMRNIEASPWLDSPELVEIKACRRVDKRQRSPSST